MSIQVGDSHLGGLLRRDISSSEFGQPSWCWPKTRAGVFAQLKALSVGGRFCWVGAGRASLRLKLRPTSHARLGSSKQSLSLNKTRLCHLVASGLFPGWGSGALGDWSPMCVRSVHRKHIIGHAEFRRKFFWTAQCRSVFG